MLSDATGTLLSCHIAVKAAVKLSDIRIAIFFLMGAKNNKLGKHMNLDDFVVFENGK